MKPLIFLLFSVLVITSRAQTKRETISDSKIGSLHCLYEKNIDVEKRDTTRYILIGFQNAQNSKIPDIRSIMLVTTKDSADVFEFKKDLISVLTVLEKKASMSWRHKNYGIIVYDSADYVLLNEPSQEGSGYTSLNKDQVQKLINWIDNIGFKD